ncbi:DUF6223 family protein [Nonomuraea sp. ATR24]|uniref:DUF6223 family protein n=1 Tax=Nonomuraea TaxID=83681 RepID=UPI001C605262|nr:DUF6223 family protein [Nonomuraea ceibae]
MPLLDAAHLVAAAQPDPVTAYTLSAGRIGSLVAALAGLAGAALGGRALARRTGRGARAGVVLGLAGTAVAVVVVVTSDGGIGTGNGLGGAFVALLIGLAATGLAGLATARSRRPS